MAGRKAHFLDVHDRRAKAITNKAAADSTTECEAIVDGEGCRRTLAQHTPGSTWQAG